VKRPFYQPIPDANGRYKLKEDTVKPFPEQNVFKLSNLVFKMPKQNQASPNLTAEKNRPKSPQTQTISIKQRSAISTANKEKGTEAQSTAKGATPIITSYSKSSTQVDSLVRLKLAGRSSETLLKQSEATASHGVMSRREKGLNLSHEELTLDTGRPETATKHFLFKGTPKTARATVTNLKFKLHSARPSLSGHSQQDPKTEMRQDNAGLKRFSLAASGKRVSASGTSIFSPFVGLSNKRVIQIENETSDNEYTDEVNNAREYEL
jgi:hypothetical protein